MTGDVELTEYETSGPLHLTPEERDALLEPGLKFALEPVRGLSDHYFLTSERVGAIALAGRHIRIAPRFGIANALFLISYALERVSWQASGHHLDEDVSLVEAVATVFVNHLRRALSHGILHGYRYEEQSLATVRGRIRLDEQIRRRFGRMPPIEVGFDDFTEDIVENRLLKAAIARLARLPLRFATTRRALGEFEIVLENVTRVKFEAGSIPAPRYTRLNAHYRPALELARFVLSGIGVEHRSGGVVGDAFLVDMSRVFEDFVVVALREALRLTVAEFPQGANGRRLWLDRQQRVELNPDVSWWHGSRCRFVADAKYKTSVRGARPDDLYQLLAYTVAADVPFGILIHASGEPSAHETVFGGKRLEVTALDLTRSPEAILQEISNLACRIAAATAEATRASA